VIDPADRGSDPVAEIEFRPERIGRREHWRPYGLTERGRQTIDVCGLARPSLLTLYTAHVDDYVRPKVKAILAAHQEADSPAVVRLWRGVLAPARPFRALSYDALRMLVPADVCARYRLAALRPGP
jgi:hypothetical protein